MPIEIGIKQAGDELTASDVNQIVAVVNATEVEAEKPSHMFFVDHFVEDGTDDETGEVLPVMKIKNTAFIAFLQSLPGWDNTGTKSLRGNMTWV